MSNDDIHNKGKKKDKYSESINKSLDSSEEGQENLLFNYLCPEPDIKIKNIVSTNVVEPSKDVLSESIVSDNFNNVTEQGNYVSEKTVPPSSLHSTTETRKDDDERSLMTVLKNNNKVDTNNNNNKNCHNNIACKFTQKKLN